MSRSNVRALAGLATVLAIVAVVVFSVMMFRGGFGQTVPVTVVSERAGLVMNPEAKVKMRGVQVGQVQSIETRPDGKAVLHLAIDPDDLADIPGNVGVNITSTTVFGAKFVEFVNPRLRRQHGSRRASRSTSSTSPSRSTPSFSNSPRC